MSDDTETTEPGATDDDALERAKENKRKKEEQLKKLFSDNKTGRYGKSIDA
jgi:hypothetical protein